MGFLSLSHSLSVSFFLTHTSLSFILLLGLSFSLSLISSLFSSLLSLRIFNSSYLLSRTFPLMSVCQGEGEPRNVSHVLKTLLLYSVVSVGSLPLPIFILFRPHSLLPGGVQQPNFYLRYMRYEMSR